MNAGDFILILLYVFGAIGTTCGIMDNEESSVTLPGPLRFFFACLFGACWVFFITYKISKGSKR